MRAIEGLRRKPVTEGKELFADPRRRPEPRKFLQPRSSGSACLNSSIVFGISLAVLCARDKKPIPIEIDRLIYEIEKRGKNAALDFVG